MDRRSFLRGLAATTAAAPIVDMVPVVTDLAPFDLRPGALNFVYGCSPAMGALADMREFLEAQRRIIDRHLWVDLA